MVMAWWGGVVPTLPNQGNQRHEVCGRAVQPNSQCTETQNPEPAQGGSVGGRGTLGWSERKHTYTDTDTDTVRWEGDGGGGTQEPRMRGPHTAHAVMHSTWALTRLTAADPAIPFPCPCPCRSSAPPPPLALRILTHG